MTPGGAIAIPRAGEPAGPVSATVSVKGPDAGTKAALTAPAPDVAARICHAKETPLMSLTTPLTTPRVPGHAPSV
jgi:hypothetical protein